MRRLRFLALTLAKRAVRSLHKDRIGRVIAVVVVDVDTFVALGDSRHTRIVGAEAVVVDSRNLRLLLAALNSQRIGPAIAIVGSLWRGG